MDEKYIGRRVSLGMGVEGERGVAAAPSYFARFLSLDFDDTSNVVQNESAMGVVEKFNDSATTSKWAEGSVEAKMTDVGIGYFLYNIMGLATSEAQGEEGTYKHTFNIGQSQTPPTMTFYKRTPVSSKRYRLGTVGEFSLALAIDDYVKFTSQILSMAGEESSIVPAFIDETEFTASSISVKLSEEEITEATPVIQATSTNLTINRTAETRKSFNGTEDISDIVTGAYELTGDITLAHENDVYTDYLLQNTALKGEITIENKSVLLADGTHPRLIIKLPQVRFSEQSKNNDLDTIIEQTLNLSVEYNVSEAKAIEIELYNDKENYNV